MPRIIPIHSTYEVDPDEYGYDSPLPSKHITPAFTPPQQTSLQNTSLTTPSPGRPPRPVIIPPTPESSSSMPPHYDSNIYAGDKATAFPSQHQHHGHDEEKTEKHDIYTSATPYNSTNLTRPHLPPPPRRNPQSTTISTLPPPPNASYDESVPVNPFNGNVNQRNQSQAASSPRLVPPSLHADYSPNTQSIEEVSHDTRPRPHLSPHRNAYSHENSDIYQQPPPYTQIEIKKDEHGVPIAPKAPLMPTTQDLHAQHMVLIEEAKLEQLTKASWWPRNQQVYYPLIVLVALACIVIMSFVPGFQHNPYLYKINYLPILFGIALGFGVVTFGLTLAHSIYALCTTHTTKTRNTASVVYYITQGAGIVGMTIFSVIPFIICMSNKSLFNRYAGVVAISCWWVSAVIGVMALIWLNIRAAWDGIKLIQRPKQYEVSAPLQLATY